MLIQRDTLKLSMSGQKPKRGASERVSPKVPPPVDMFLKTPLYERFAFTKVGSTAVREILAFGQPLDFYCEKCKAESVCRTESSRYLGSDEVIKDRVYSRTF